MHTGWVKNKTHLADDKQCIWMVLLPGDPWSEEEDARVVGAQVVRDVGLEEGAAHAVARHEDRVERVAHLPEK